MTQPNHGNAWKAPHLRAQKLNITLYPQHIEMLRELGDNKSKVIRRLIEQAAKGQNKSGDPDATTGSPVA